MADVPDVQDVNAGHPILELFKTNTRSSGASLAYQLSVSVSGFTALWAVFLYQAYGWPGAIL